jgi:superoxide dismutase
MLETIIRRLQQQLSGKTHSAVAVNIGRPNTHTQVVSVMTSKDKGSELTPEELEKQAGSRFPSGRR